MNTDNFIQEQLYQLQSVKDININELVWKCHNLDKEESRLFK